MCQQEGLTYPIGTMQLYAIEPHFHSIGSCLPELIYQLHASSSDQQH